MNIPKISKKQLLTPPNFSLLGDIREHPVSNIQDVLQNLFDQDTQHFTLFISSDGGSPWLAKMFAERLRDMKEALGIEIYLCVQKDALSAGAMTVLYAKNFGLKVYAYPEAIFMFHGFSYTFPEMVSLCYLQNFVARQTEFFQEFVQIYADVSQIEVSQLTEEFAEEKEFSTQEAFKRNLIDAIVDS